MIPLCLGLPVPPLGFPGAWFQQGGDLGIRGLSGLRHLLGWDSLCRPLREDSPDAEWQETQEEEDDGEEEDPEPLLQRVLQLRDPL